jgi:hypothetical protein
VAMHALDSRLRGNDGLEEPRSVWLVLDSRLRGNDGLEGRRSMT